MTGGGCPSRNESEYLKYGPLICQAECAVATSGLSKIIQNASVCTNTNAVQADMKWNTDFCDGLGTFAEQQSFCSFAVESEENCGKCLSWTFSAKYYH
jgi:hypothetical protein